MVISDLKKALILGLLLILPWPAEAVLYPSNVATLTAIPTPPEGAEAVVTGTGQRYDYTHVGWQWIAYQQGTFNTNTPTGTPTSTPTNTPVPSPTYVQNTGNPVPVDLNSQTLSNVESLGIGEAAPNTAYAMAAINGDAQIGNAVLAGQKLYLMATHTASANAMFLGISGDGYNFGFVGLNQPVLSDSSLIRDPNIIYYEGSYLVCYSYGYPATPSYGVIGIAQSYDGISWPSSQNYPVTFNSTGTATETWAPHWYVDPNTNNLWVFVAQDVTDSDSHQQILAIQCLSTTSPVTNFSAPVTVLGGGNFIDPSIIYVSPYYWMIVKNETTKYLDEYQCSTVNGTYSAAQTGAWAGFPNPAEAPSIVQVSPTDYRLWMCAYGSGQGSIAYDAATWPTTVWTGPTTMGYPIPAANLSAKVNVMTGFNATRNVAGSSGCNNVWQGLNGSVSLQAGCTETVPNLAVSQITIRNTPTYSGPMTTDAGISATPVVHTVLNGLILN